MITGAETKPKDPIIALCGSCQFRPTDPETGKPVEGALRLAQRPLRTGNRAVVIYSVEDPRINAQFRVQDNADHLTAIRDAQVCTPVAAGMSSSLGPTFEQRLKAEQSQQLVACKIGRTLIPDVALPPGLLYQRPQAQPQ